MSKTATIHLHTDQGKHALLTSASAILHKDISTFILDTACNEAESVILDQRVLRLNETEFASFEEALITPVIDSAKLKMLLSETAPWD